MNIKLGRFNTTLRLWPTLVVSLACALLIWLGTWQVQRAGHKQTVLAEHMNKTTSAEIVLHEDPNAPTELLQMHPVTATGTLDTEHTILLDNSIRDSMVGYEVLVPLRLQGSNSAVLVNRGWLPRGPERALKPMPEHPPGEIRVKGVAVRPAAGFRLGTMLEPGSRWPHVVQFVALEEIQPLVGYPLLPVVVRLTADDPLALRTGWPVVTLGPERHYGYAVTWYGLGLALLVVFVAACTRRCA